MSLRAEKGREDAIFQVFTHSALTTYSKCSAFKNSLLSVCKVTTLTTSVMFGKIVTLIERLLRTKHFHLYQLLLM